MGYLIIDWARFVPAVVLLLTPIAILQGPAVHFRDIDRDWDRHWPQIRSLWQHYFDFARAALGTWLLLAALAPVANAHGIARYAPLLVQGGLRILAVFLQTLVCRERDSINAPFAFLTGLLIAGASPLVAVIVLSLTVAFTTGARAPAAFFPLLAVMCPAVGLLFGGTALMINSLPGSCVALLPWLWSLLFHRELVVAYRSSHLVRTEPPLARPASKR